MKPSISSDYAVLEAGGAVFYYGYEYLLEADRQSATQAESSGGYVRINGGIVFQWEDADGQARSMADGLIITMGKFFEACSEKSAGKGLALPF